MDGGAEGGKRKVEEKRVSEKAARVGGSRREESRRKESLGSRESPVLPPQQIELPRGGGSTP